MDSLAALAHRSSGIASRHWGDADLGLISLPGAVVGALLLGVAESWTGACLTIQFKNTLAFVIIIPALPVQPEGRLGKEFKVRV